MRWRYLLLTLMVVWIAGPVHAEFYRYTDKNGVTRFTDNLADVPMDQRPGAQKYETADTPAAPGRVPTAGVGPEGPRPAEPAPKVEENSIEIPPGPDYDRLSKIKTELDQEHAELTKEKAVLDKETDIFSSNEKFEAYKAKVTRFNLRKEAYDKRVEAFQQELKAYSESGTPEQPQPQ